MKPKTVLLASNLYRPNIGGVENSLYHLGLAYLESGYRVVIAASDINHENRSLPLKEMEQGMHVYRYPINQVSGPLRYFRHWINAVTLFKKLKKEYQPDLVVCRYHQTGLMMGMAGLKDYIYLIPGVVKFQNASENLSQRSRPLLSRLKYAVDFRLNKILQKMAFKQAQKLAVFSQSMIEQVTSIIDIDVKNIFVGKPGVSLERFYLASNQEKQDARETLGLTGQSPVFFCIGRFVRAKGFDLVIQALEQVDGAQLCILGAGEEKEHYQQLIEQYGLSDRVFLHGSSNQPELYYRASDYFLMSSRYEPLGQTILEALASGMPIIAFPSSLVETATFELLGEDHAFYAESVSPESMAKAMGSVLQMTPEEREKIRYNNHQFASQHFTWTALARQLQQSIS